MCALINRKSNFITILALCQSTKLKTHCTTAFVISLCVSDLIFCAVNLPLTAARYIYETWIFGDALCQLFPVLFYGNVAGSVLSMTAIAINRVVLITLYEYYTKLCSRLSICLQLLGTWVIALLITLPSLLGVWGRLGLDPSTFSCTILQKDGKSPKKIVFICGFIIPCLVIIVSYSCIYWKVKTSEIRTRSHDPIKNQRSAKRERDDRRLTKLMALIFFCFLLCFLPLMLTNVFDDRVTYPVFHVVASILAWASAAINPLIYAGTNKQYRSAYKKLLHMVRSSVTGAPAESAPLTNPLSSKQDPQIQRDSNCKLKDSSNVL
ncbi:protein trapped in endoderm-1 isoform X2 [Anthonomus grandis grandis]|uniref:protein trapped in endoderm-1 isoform X2 n=1 Tax=Anthonomus grandis grandis TaxID=2921223 RepID=UPI0021658782|nr:protein trapped in endoderm-1 isoform X2 [Anthonomus grandis grandis]